MALPRAVRDVDRNYSDEILRAIAGQLRKFTGESAIQTQPVIEDNWFIERTLPGGVVRELNDDEMSAYRAPFLEIASQEPLYRFPNGLPIAGAPADVWAIAEAYYTWLLETETPQAAFLGHPGCVHLARACR